LLGACGRRFSTGRSPSEGSTGIGSLSSYVSFDEGALAEEYDPFAEEFFQLLFALPR
jgi:hypothetical protein